MRVDAAISRVFSPSHMKRLSQEEGFELPSHPLQLERLCHTAYEERNHAFSTGDNSDPSSMKVPFLLHTIHLPLLLLQKSEFWQLILRKNASVVRLKK